MEILEKIIFLFMVANFNINIYINHPDLLSIIPI